MHEKIVAITGVSSGIGAEAAKLFRALGTKIIGFDLNEPELDVDEFHKVDLSDQSSIEEVVSKVGGKIDFLCNIAGVPPTLDKRTVLRVNFFGLRHFTYGIAPLLQSNGAIVSVASLAGMGWRDNLDVVRSGLATSIHDADAWIDAQPVDGAPSYHLSKELLIAWTVANWDFLRARGIRMNTVSPGPVSTPILRDFIRTLGKRAEEDLKLNRAGTPEEIARVILFLCSPEAAWINGADIAADGGAGSNALRGMMRLEPEAQPSAQGV